MYAKILKVGQEKRQPVVISKVTAQKKKTVQFLYVDFPTIEVKTTS
jgi:hypothetical protein